MLTQNNTVNMQHTSEHYQLGPYIFPNGLTLSHEIWCGNTCGE